MATNNERLLAFEGAQGFGAQTTGGRGGTVIKVTNLNDSGVGSLRWALEQQDGPRTVVFEVGGLIKLSQEIEINGNVTIAGQTAPGGITVAGARLRIMEDNVIMQGLEIRPGEESWGDPDRDNRDGISIGRAGESVKNVIIDSNSISWSIDEGVSIWGDVSNVTFSNNIVANALKDSIHPKGDHSMAMIVGDGASRISIINNLLAHNEYRNPLIKDGSHQIEFINNLIYNYGNSGLRAIGETTAHIINNVYIKGADSFGGAPIQIEQYEAGAKYFVSGNVGAVKANSSYLSSGHIFTPGTKTVLATKDVQKYVLEHAGANADDRSAVDARVIRDVIERIGNIIDSQDEVGGYSGISGKRAPTDTDKDGIPDVYEGLIGSDARNADANKDSDGDGYTNIEEYLNGLISGFDKVVTSTPTETNEGPQLAPEPEPTPVVEKTPTTTTSGQKITVEAENLKIDSGFVTKDLGGASGGKIIQAGSKDVQKASLTFNGDAGKYDLSIDYFDESDGASKLTVSVNNQQVASWTWDQMLGTHLANHTSLTTKVLEGLDLKPGDTIQLSGTSNGGEPLRIDKLVFDAAGGTSTTTASGPALAGQSIRVQAEDFALDGFRVDSLNFAEGEEIIRADGNAAHRASHKFEGPSGVYDILVDYFDEADGESELKLNVNGRTVETWVWDDSILHKNATPGNLTTHVIEGVKLAQGDAIVLIGLDDGPEPLRIDAVEFELTNFV